MPLQTIEIICVPCLKCDGLEQKIRGMVDNIGVLSKIKISYEFKHTKKLDTISQYALTPAQMPVILVNGQVEMAGRIDSMLLRKKLETLQRSC